MGEQLPDGIYIGLPEDQYFAQDRIGSTDLALLFEEREGWWWQSRHNTVHKVNQGGTPAQAFGSALHCLLLEGREAFNDRYYVMPHRDEFPDLLVTSDDLEGALAHANAPVPGSKRKKADLVEYARVYLQHRNVWDLILEEAHAERGIMEAIEREEFRDLMLMRDLAMSRPFTRGILEPPGAHRLPELTVFDTVTLPGLPPIKVRFRFDAIFPLYAIDLKTVGYTTAGFDTEISRRLSDWSMRVQAGWSFRMRAALNRLAGEGRIYGCDAEPDRKLWITRFSREAPVAQSAWVWLFAQRPLPSGSAPLIQPVVMHYDNPIAIEGNQAAVEALRFLGERQPRLGDWKAWASSREPAELADLPPGGELQPGQVRAFSPRRRPSPDTPILND